MTLGKRIRYFRLRRGMSQMQLGLMLGFPDSNANTRIGQYECNSRSPKNERLNDFAEALHISPLALTVPNISNLDELMHLLFMLEDEFGLKISCTRKGEVFLSFKPSDEKQSNLLYIMLMEWAYETQLLSSGKRTKQDYDEWRYSYSHQTTPKPRKKYRIRGLKKVKDDLTQPAQ